MTTTLRQRRKGESSAVADDETSDSRDGALGEPMMGSQGPHAATCNEDDDHDHHHNDGYSLTPLVQRSMVARLDVGPFLVAYLVLGLLDNCEDAAEDQTPILLQPLTWAFLFLLLCHLTLVLMQQWSVSVRCLVGYTKANQTVSSLTPEAKEAVISRWTHCLVEEEKGAQDRKSSADTSGIATVEIKTIPPQQQFKVAVVNYHDFSFRCPTAPLDLDTLMWTATDVHKNSESSTKQQQSKKIGFHRVRFPITLPVSFYQKWKGHDQVDSIFHCHHLYGANAMFLQLPTFTELLSQQVVAPFFLFQIFCVTLWSLDEYWYYAIFTLLALLSFESTVAYNRLQGLQRLRNATRHNDNKLWVFRKGFGARAGTAQVSPWIKITAHELLPGDIVSLSSEPDQSERIHSSSPHNSVPADILLLKGNAVVDEALLTGESIPQIKVPFDPSSSNAGHASNQVLLDAQGHKESILFGGTVLLTSNPFSAADGQSKNDDKDDIPEAPNDGVIGMVLRTGFETAQGSLLRTIAHSSHSVEGVHSLDTFVFILLLLCCAIASASLVLRDGWGDETRNRFRLTLHVVIIMTSVIPPELPMELSLAVTNSVTDLMKRCQVYCTEHYRIPWAGLVDVCCFDKTGTLTSDQMRLKGIRLFDQGEKDLEHLNEEKALVKPGDDNLPWSAVRIMASCHSLALRINRGKMGISSQLIGDPLEQAVLKDTGWQLVGSNLLLLSEGPQEGRPKSISILHRFAFSSQLKRMTVQIAKRALFGL
jgi:magnesium-transporting ATPase (P-type)